jgi:dTDP-4-dehydrorhamnose reductase
MLKLMKERDSLSVVNDQRGSPTWAYDLANTIADIIIAVDGGKNLPYGKYHFTNEGNISWFDFAREIYGQGRKMGILTKDCEIKPCTSAEFPAKVTRPSYSVLNKGKIKSAVGIAIPEWNISLEKFLTICEN